MDELARFSWLEEPVDVLEALSLTLVSPASNRAIATLRPSSEWPQALTLAGGREAALQMDDFGWGSLLAQVDEIDGWTAIVEPVGWAAAQGEVVSELSQGGVAVNVCWNVNAVMSATYARDGRLVREFDPLLYRADGAALAEEAGLPFGEPGAPLRAACLAFLERLTGVRIEREWLLDRPRRTVVVPVP
jgi:hypothetical protein